jgi:hypothetical protein
LKEHFEAIFCKLLAKPGGLYVIVAEVAGCVVFENATSIEKIRVMYTRRNLPYCWAFL